MLKKIQVFLITILIVVVFPAKELYASTLFSDNFDFRDENKWKYITNGGDITFNNGIMFLSSVSTHFPFITNSEANKFNNSDSVILEISYNYGTIGYMGNGFGVGYTGENDYPYYQFSIWNDLNAGLVFQYRNLNASNSNGCKYDYGESPLLKIPVSPEFNDNRNHDLKIVKNFNRYTVLIDSSVIFVSDDNQCVPSNIFIGNPLSGGRTDWNELNIDNVKIYTEINSLIPNKIIILPGLGASWNPNAILSGSTAPSNVWTMTPLVKNYDSLIKALEINGLIKNQDFYVWNYDWRKPLSQIVVDFSNFIKGLNLEDGQRINLVGHSLGGLVARVWTQEHSNLVDKTITLGSPHYGSVKAYEAWYGAKVGDSLGIDSIALNILLQLHKKDKETLVESLRSFAPIVSDLIPTFSFLKKNGIGVTTKVNSYLMLKNSSVNVIDDKLLTIDGIGTTTKEWINLGKRSVFDQVFGFWEEGTPISYLYGSGDGTVLKKSALISGIESSEFKSNHGNLVDKSVNFVLQKLGLGTTVSVISNYPVKQLVFYLGSPAIMTVKCGGMERSDIDGWVIMENQILENCNVKLIGTGNGGTYHLVIGDSKDWKYIEGKIKNGQTIKIEGVDKQNCWPKLKKSFENLKLYEMQIMAKKENVDELLSYFLSFKIRDKRYKYDREIMDGLMCVYKNRRDIY